MYLRRACFYLFLIGQILVFFFTLNPWLHAQNYDALMTEARSPDSIDLQIENLISLEPDFISAPKEVIGHLHYFIAYRFYNLDDFENIIKHSSLSIDNYTQADYLGYRLARSFLMRGKAYQNLGMLQEALQDYESIINLTYTPRGLAALSEAHYRKAQLFRFSGEFESSYNYLNAFIGSEEFDRVSNYDKATIYRELSIAYAGYSSTEKKELALLALEKADEVYANENVKNTVNLEQIVLNEMQKGLLALGQENYELAINYYQNSITLMGNNTSDQIFINLIALSRINISENLIKTDRCEEASLVIDQADKHFFSDDNPKYMETRIEIMIRKATAYACLKDLRKAIQLFSDIKNVLLGKTTIDNVLGLRNYPHKKWLIDALIEEYQFNVDRRSSEQLTNLKKVAYQIDSLIDFRLTDMYFESSLQQAKDEYTEFYLSALEIANDLNDHDFYWFLTEKLNNLLLLMNIQREVEMEDQLDLLSINKEIKLLSIQSSKLENDLFFNKSKKNLRLVDSLQQLLIKNKARQLDYFLERDQYLTSNITTISDLSSVVSSLKKGESVVSYKFSRSQLLAIHITRDGSTIYDLGDSDRVKNILGEWYDSASNPIDKIEAVESFNQISEQLYKILIDPIADLQSTVTIIPDAELYYLNFETLQSDKQRYLIYNHTISYELSGTLLLDNRTLNQNRISVATAFIPSYSGTDLPNLAYTNAGIKALEELAGLKLNTNQETTKENFISALQSSDILHFGGHAIKIDENNKYSHLALKSDNQTTRNIISLGDLYSMSAKAQLVALPACHSGSGDLLVGEGISNLSRGFFYAGAKSVISSIWEANDKSNSIIMNSFYENILDGKSRSSSLRLAKLDYLSSAPEFLRHPNLWGGLILTGDNRSLSFEHTLSFNYLLALLSLALVFGIFLLYKRIQK